MHTPDHDHERRVPLDPSRQPAGIGPPRGVGVVRRRGERQRPADRLDPVGRAVTVDEGDHRLDWRLSFEWAKYADALLMISLACRSSRTSRSSTLIRSRSSLAGPARLGPARLAGSNCAASHLCSRSWRQSSGSRTIASRARSRTPAPAGRSAREPEGRRAGYASSWLWAPRRPACSIWARTASASGFATPAASIPRRARSGPPASARKCPGDDGPPRSNSAVRTTLPCPVVVS